MKINELRIFPICKASRLTQKLIKDLCIEITKNKDKNIDTTDLEQQIDNLVYKLYELTYDEVLVVEPEFGERMSREEYEGLKVE